MPPRSVEEGSLSTGSRRRSQVDAQPRQRLAQDVVLGVARARLAKDALRLVGAAGGPEHLAEVGGDLGVGTPVPSNSFGL